VTGDERAKRPGVIILLTRPLTLLGHRKAHSRCRLPSFALRHRTPNRRLARTLPMPQMALLWSRVVRTLGFTHIDAHAHWSDQPAVRTLGEPGPGAPGAVLRALAAAPCRGASCTSCLVRRISCAFRGLHLVLKPQSYRWGWILPVPTPFAVGLRDGSRGSDDPQRHLLRRDDELVTCRTARALLSALRLNVDRVAVASGRRGGEMGWWG